MADHATKAQLAERSALVEEMYIRRAMSKRAVESALARKWGCTPRNVRHYIAKVMKAYQEASEEPARERRLRYREMLLSDHSRALDAEEFGAAAQIARIICQLDGVLTDRVEVEHSGTVAHVHITAAELAAKLDGATPDELAALERVATRLLPATVKDE